jgi:ornithine cyclodeaminase/alanine dehydrogenase-like protein (mu-crystallin family)
MPVLYLTEEDVTELMDMEMCIDILEEAFQQLAAGKAVNVPRVRVQAPGACLHTMSASAEYLGLIGWKAYSTTRAGAKFLVGIYRIDDGELVALIEASQLGRLRTGAASGVATEYMARPDAKVVGVFGTGFQARTQLKAVCTVRKIERVEVYSRNEERRHKFAEEMSEWCNTKVVPVHAPDDAATEKDIVICATTSRAPLFDGRVLDEGTHLNVVGANYLNRAEIDVATIRRADVIVCDSIEQCKLEAGDFTAALEQGVTDWELMHNLSDVVTGQTAGRPLPESITLFKSVGLAIEDVAVAAKLFDRARTEGLGRELPF